MTTRLLAYTATGLLLGALATLLAPRLWLGGVRWLAAMGEVRP